MLFERDEDHGKPCYIVTLDEDEGAMYDKGEDGKRQINTRVFDEIAARDIMEEVFVYHTNGLQLWWFEAGRGE